MRLGTGCCSGKAGLPKPNPEASPRGPCCGLGLCLADEASAAQGHAHWRTQAFPSLGKAWLPRPSLAASQGASWQGVCADWGGWGGGPTVELQTD